MFQKVPDRNSARYECGMPEEEINFWQLLSPFELLCSLAERQMCWWHLSMSYFVYPWKMHSAFKTPSTVENNLLIALGTRVLMHLPIKSSARLRLYQASVGSVTLVTQQWPSFWSCQHFFIICTILSAWPLFWGKSELLVFLMTGQSWQPPGRHIACGLLSLCTASGMPCLVNVACSADDTVNFDRFSTVSCRLHTFTNVATVGFAQPGLLEWYRCKSIWCGGTQYSRHFVVSRKIVHG